MTLTGETAVPLRHADRFFIDGGWVEPSSDATIDVIDSGTEEVYFRVPEAQAADIDRAVTAARRAFDEGPWPTMTHAERAGFLRGIADGLRERAEDIGQIWPRESGALYVIAKHSAAGTAAGFDYYAGLADTFPFEERAQPVDGRSSACWSASRWAWWVRSSRGTPRIGPHHLQGRPGPAGRVHRRPQVLARGARRRLRGGRDRRGHRPAGRGPQRRHRRPRGLRAAGPRSAGRQDHLHRLDRRRPADRLDLRRADRPLHPRAGWQVGRASSSTTWTSQQAAATLAARRVHPVGTGLLLADPDRGHPSAARRVGRRAGRRLLPGPGGRPVRPRHPDGPARRPAASATGSRATSPRASDEGATLVTGGGRPKDLDRG